MTETIAPVESTWIYVEFWPTIGQFRHVVVQAKDRSSAVEAAFARLTDVPKMEDQADLTVFADVFEITR